MGGQACILYGAAEFSRDVDVAVLADNRNLSRLQAALDDLRAEPVFVPPLSADVLRRGHACHFRCRAAGVEGLRIDVMSVLRGCARFEQLWARRKTLVLPDVGRVHLLALPDLVQAKKTQRDKDWPMIRRLMEADYHQSTRPTRARLSFWLRDLRTSELLIALCRKHAALARRLGEEPARAGAGAPRRRGGRGAGASDRAGNRSAAGPGVLATIARRALTLATTGSKVRSTLIDRTTDRLYACPTNPQVPSRIESQIPVAGDKQMRKCLLAVILSIGLTPRLVSAQAGAEVDVQKVVDAFHAGIKSGDSAAVMRLLAPDVLLLEAGGIETRAQYEKDHLPADIEFEKSVTTAFKPSRVTVVGNTAWAVSTSEYKGTFRERPIDSIGVELMILSRDASGWRIRAIHWSSRARRPPQ